MIDGRMMLAALAVIAALPAVHFALAQPAAPAAPKPEMMENCPGLVAHDTPRAIPAERLVPALAFARFAPPIGAFWRARGLRLIATDVDWSGGRGPEVRGPGEALLMAIAGRRGAVEELDGPGQPTLAGRIS